jgi:hypothetical protein
VPYAFEYAGNCSRIPTATEKEEFFAKEEYCPDSLRCRAIVYFRSNARLAIERTKHRDCDAPRTGEENHRPTYISLSLNKAPCENFTPKLRWWRVKTLPP